MSGRLQDMVALVTGGASGIGQGCAERLAQEGAISVIVDIQDQKGAEVRDGILAAGGRCSYSHLDVTDEDNWIAVIAEIKAKYGRLDILVNNAGIGAGGPIADMALESWRRVMEVNLDGVFLGVKHAVPLMREGGRGGSIMNMSSIAGMQGIPGQAAYSATKGGVRLFSKALALELAPDQIRVNSIHPGLIDTPIYGAGRERLDDMASRLVPLGMKGFPVDIANAVLWLASEEGAYVTGQEIVVDGGFVTR